MVINHSLSTRGDIQRMEQWCGRQHLTCFYIETLPIFRDPQNTICNAGSWFSLRTCQKSIKVIWKQHATLYNGIQWGRAHCFAFFLSNPRKKECQESQNTPIFRLEKPVFPHWGNFASLMRAHIRMHARAGNLMKLAYILSLMAWNIFYIFRSFKRWSIPWRRKNQANCKVL